MSGNGPGIAGTIVTVGLRRTVVHGLTGTAGIVLVAFSAAGLGTATRRISGRRAAAGTAPEIGTTSAGSAWPGRSSLESLLPHLLGVRSPIGPFSGTIRELYARGLTGVKDSFTLSFAGMNGRERGQPINESIPQDRLS